MYKFAFWIMVSAILFICHSMLKTGGAVFPRIETLESKVEALDYDLTILEERLQNHKHRFFTQEVVQ